MVCLVVGGRVMMGRVVRVWKSGRKEEGKVVVMIMGRMQELDSCAETTSMRMR